MDLEGATKIPPMQTPRSHLLLSCGESILAVAQKAYRRVEAMRCPVGCLARGFSHMAAPILSPLQLRCLSALSFVDRQLIVVQDVTAVLFPRSERAFRKVDELVLLMESLPARLDGAIDGLEAFVAGVKGGVIPKRCCQAGVFRDIRCDEEEGASQYRAVADEVRAMEKRCEDATRKVESVEVVTVHGDGDEGGTGDPTETIGVGPAEKITGDTERDEKTDLDVVQGAYEKATRPGTGEQEVSCDDTARTLKGERKEEASPMKRDMASGGEECAEGVETHAAEIMAAMQSTEIAEVESQEAAAPHEEGSSAREEAISMSGRESEVDAFFDLFDEAWQQRLA